MSSYFDMKLDPIGRVVDTCVRDCPYRQRADHTLTSIYLVGSADRYNVSIGHM
jgi:hypothetical protein